MKNSEEILRACECGCDCCDKCDCSSGKCECGCEDCKCCKDGGCGCN